jgi:hypothetical protein
LNVVVGANFTLVISGVLKVGITSLDWGH